MKRYNPKEIEPKWQQRWAESKIYEATESPTKPKRYVLEYFPYPSGAAMHVGHVRNYTIGDAVARHARMTGHNVLHPMGWDAFGLPAENYAIKNNISPQQAIAENTSKFKNQLIQMGFSYDWSREIDSSDPGYYKWTQWFFKLLLERGLAYQKDSLQWWCETDKTVLANEQVEAGKCWRCGNVVVKKPLKQWFFSITDYADRLSDDLDNLDWSEAIKSMQRNWIGKSKGAEVEFVIGEPNKHADTLKFTPRLTELIQQGKKGKTIRLEPKNLQIGDMVKLQTRYDAKTVASFGLAEITAVETMKLKDIPNDYQGYENYANADERLVTYKGYYGEEVTLETELTIYSFQKQADIVTVFTTRPDTLYGATFMVLAPEHPLVQHITIDEQRDTVAKYVFDAQQKSDIERQENKEKSGVFTGAYAVNPVNNEQIPVWVADYVLMGYGTGAIMAVPAHDERDYEFATKFNLPVRQVIAERFEHAENTHRPDAPTVPREVICAVVKHPTEDKYLIAKPKESDFWSPVMGGIDDGETPEQAARRELREETGYDDIKSIEAFNEVLASVFYAQHKNVNRIAYLNTVKIELASLRAQDISEEESAAQDNYWATPEEVAERCTGAGAKEVYEIAAGKKRDLVHEGLLINSGEYNGTASSDARERITAKLGAAGNGKEVTNYKIRDWLISRQRYWGAPIPVIHCEKHGAVPVPDSDLPVVLPEVESYLPTGEGTSVLASVSDWVNVPCPTCGGPAKRETDTMDGFACSSWYFLRFADPHNTKAPFTPERAKFWLPVDDYIGGAEHAVMHLLYARMWTKVLHDAGLIEFDEPFTSLRNHGMILAPDGRKMSKSWGNTITPDEIISDGYGADAIRVMELFIGPWNQMANWSVEGMGGCYRFLQRIWTLAQEYQDAVAAEKIETLDAALLKTTHQTIHKVSKDISQLGFNTAIAALMEQVNELYRLKQAHGFADKAEWGQSIATLLQLLAPFAPHITDELWEQLGSTDSIHVSSWPSHDDKYLLSDVVTIAIQVNGKLRGEIEVDADSSEEVIVAAAQIEPKVASHLTSKTIRKTIYVPGKIVNFVAN
jgi:leucyl-tRNA synthetase